MLHGSGRNRWFDKVHNDGVIILKVNWWNLVGIDILFNLQSFQLIVCKNGKAALNFEHAWWVIFDSTLSGSLFFV
jgi:hypothetical protein